MPSKSKKQAKLMRAVAHGWKPSRIKGPTRTVAKEFVDADKRRDEVTGYQFGGGVPYRGVPPQRGMISRGAGGDPREMAGRMRGQMPRGGGYGRAGGVPGTIGGFGGYQGQGRSPFGGGMPQGGALRQMMQQMQMQQMRGGQPGGGRFVGGPGAGRPVPRPAQPRGGAAGRMAQAQNRFGALRQAGGPGGGVMGKMTPQIPGRPNVPGRRIAGPPGKYPGGGNPNLRGRNPMLRQAQNRRGRGATSYLR